MNSLLVLCLFVLGSLGGNLAISGHLAYGIPLTIVGLLFALYLFRDERREQEFSRKLVDKPLY
ncbi:MAG: hypothetical protein JRN20_01215 [Nitrososphaerota archaeon]|nr:hypothetical protein [Nitrososphaerota archaeon]MDG6922186.1 hypothetical protein [Nitrososphaerota archaeon]